jgi:uncharacterized membrane protein (UPF0127 family)
VIPRRRGLAAVILGSVLLTFVVGCASDATTSPAAPTTKVGAAAAPTGTDGAGGRTRLDGFKEVTITVVGADGQSRQHCLLLADTEPLRERGLMFVEDATLGGYDGMLFLFPSDSAGGFWMKNTRLPLSIAYVAANGRTVSTTDMAPCPDSTPDCPSYPAAGRYRFAVEVPQGQLGKVGLSDESTLTVGEQTCAGVPRSS